MHESFGYPTQSLVIGVISHLNFNHSFECEGYLTILMSFNVYSCGD
jgi:hypothetical protein